MTEQLRIAQDIANITQLDSLTFEKQLQKYLQTKDMLLILADLIAADFQDSQKILAASAINRILINHLDNDYKKWPIYWEQFCRDVLMHPQIDKIEWRHLATLVSGTSYILEDMAEHLCTTINPIFSELNFKVKVLLYQSFARTQTTQETRYIFLRETIESYIEQVLKFVCLNHQKHNKVKDNLELQKSILQNLCMVLNNLEKYLNDSLINELLVKLSLNDSLFQLIVQQLLYDADKVDYECIRKKQFSPERMKELVIVSKSKDDNIKNHLNEVKAHTIRIFAVLLRQYDKKAEVKEFDHYKHLNYMENFTPIVVQKLIDLISKNESMDNYPLVIISLLKYLTQTVKFNFLLQFYDNNLQKLLFKVCFPLLRADENEITEFEDNSQGFIQTAQEAIQMPQDEDCAETIKNAASQFLQKIVSVLDGSLVFVMESNMSIIKYVLTGKIQEGLLSIIKKFDYETSIQASLTILSLFSDIYMNRQDLLQLIKNKLLDSECMTGLIKLDLARMFIFLAYNFENIYKRCEDEGAKFLILAARELQSETAISQCALMLLQNCLKLGFGQQIWDNLLMKLQNTKIITIFKIFRRIVEEKLQDLPVDYTKTLITRLIQRFISEFQNAEEKNGIKMTSIFMSEIFNILEIITENKKYIKNEPTIIDTVWDIFDLFQFVEKIEFQDDLLKVFNHVLAVSPIVDRKFFQFLNHFPNFHLKFKGFNEILLSTFTNLLQKGRQHFLNDKEQPSSLQKVVQCLKHCYSIYKKQESMVHFCIFMQYIFIQYSFLLKNDGEFFQILLRFYDQNKNSWQNQTKAAVINLFIIAEFDFGGIDLKIIKENSIQIFQGYQANIFALGLRRLIEKYHTSDQIIDYLCYSIRLLHFLREVNSADTPSKKVYYTPNFKGLCEIDPFQQIRGQLEFIKRTLQPSRYDSIIQILRREISLGEIKDLLSRRLVDNNLRTIYKVRQD